MNKILNVACLVRVSHEEQVKHGYSLDAQKESLQNWIDENGHKIAGWYIDEGVSARKKVKNRPALQRLLLDVQRGGIDLIIFIKLDRYFRSVAEYHETQKTLEYNGTHWKAILEDYDTTTTDGRFKINIMLSIAEQEADRTSDRIKFAFEHKLKKKQPLTGAQPTGYMIGMNEDGTKRIIKDAAAAPYVEMIFEHFLQFQSVSATTAYINREQGYKINYHTIKKILTNPYYCGEYRGIEDYCPAYITRETFDRIQHIRKTRNVKTPQTRRVYIFTGLLQCPECGGRLTSVINIKNGKEYQNYRCDKSHKHKSCDFKRVFSELKLEKYMLSRIRPELEKYIAEIEIAAPTAAPVGDRDEITAEMDRLNYMFRKNRIPVDEYETEYEKLETKLAKLDASAPAPVDVPALRDFLNSDILDLYGGLSREDKRAAWRTIIDKIVMDVNGNHAVKFL